MEAAETAESAEPIGSVAEQVRREAGEEPEAAGEQPDGGGEPQTPVGPSPADTRLTRLARDAREQREDGVIRVSEDESLELREDAAEGKEMPDDDWESVQDWLLGDTVDVVTRRIEIRIGGSDETPTFIPWVMKAIPIEAIRTAEREASGNREARRGGGGRQPAKYDELAANLRIVVEGTVKPDIKAAAEKEGLRDPTVLLKRKMAYRPGLIARLAGEILGLSGFDESDVRAAGN